MSDSPAPTYRPPMSRRKKIIFAAIALVLASIVGLAGLELGLRVMALHIPKDPFLSFGTVPDFFVRRNIEGVPHYQVAHRDVYSERLTKFTATKEPNTIRIICLGASASAGWPHEGDEIYSVYLQDALQRAYPQKRIEVLNLSAHAYAAYRVRLIFEEALEFDPDVMVVWSGNNEFLEKRVYRTNVGWAEPLLALANQSLLYRGIRGSRVGRWAFPDNTLSAYERGHHLFTMWSKLEQVAVELRTRPEQFEAVKRHFAASIEAMVARADARGVPVVLATVPVNLRDWQPAVSCHAADQGAWPQWQEKYHAGRRALARQDDDSAVVLLQEAVALDPHYAETYFYLGRAYEGRREFDRANSSFRLARDFDCNPFRAISAFGDTVRATVARHPNVVLADLDGAFHAASSPMAPGFDLFLDHVHPTKKGNLVAAETVYRALLQTRVFAAAPARAHFTYVPTPSRDTGLPYDEASDVAMQALLVRFYMAQHQDESIVARSGHLLETPKLAAKLSEKDRTFLIRAKEMFAGIMSSEAAWIGGTGPDPRGANKARLLEFYKETFEGYQEYKEKYGETAETPPVTRRPGSTTSP